MDKEKIPFPKPQPGEEAGFSKYLKQEYGGGFDTAALEGKTWTIAMLLKNEAFCSTYKWATGERALSIAAENRYHETVHYLLSTGASPWKTEGFPLPLTAALKNRQLETADILYEAMTKERPLTEAEIREIKKSCKFMPADVEAWFETKKNPLPEGWTKTGDLEVTNIQIKKEIGLTLTEIFNFENRERIVVTKDMASGQMSSFKENFDRVTNGDLFSTAAEKLVELGGNPDARDIAAGITLRRKKPFPGSDL